MRDHTTATDRTPGSNDGDADHAQPGRGSRAETILDDDVDTSSVAAMLQQDTTNDAGADEAEARWESVDADAGDREGDDDDDHAAVQAPVQRKAAAREADHGDGPTAVAAGAPRDPDTKPRRRRRTGVFRSPALISRGLAELLGNARAALPRPWMLPCNHPLYRPPPGTIERREQQRAQANPIRDPDGMRRRREQYQKALHFFGYPSDYDPEKQASKLEQLKKALDGLGKSAAKTAEGRRLMREIGRTRAATNQANLRRAYARSRAGR